MVALLNEWVKYVGYASEVIDDIILFSWHLFQTFPRRLSPLSGPYQKYRLYEWRYTYNRASPCPQDIQRRLF